MKVKTKKKLDSSVFSYSNKLIRLVWALIYFFLFKFSPIPFFSFRRFILRCFGAKIGRNVNIYPTVKVWLPSNLSILDNSTLGPNVIIYNQGDITIGRRVIVSQGAHLCASTHDYNDPLHPLLLAPIIISNDVWICAEAFVGPNVEIAEGCVIGARTVLTKNTEAWTVYSGNPAKGIKKRAWSSTK
ncbi:colanic acid biosynthesis acetyltransferase WcaF [Shewanella vesiculosa]|uniref:colanic acid biosynthesis acetyltransferase WcaF n=1 Tax=Shewanella vesiculosa TaxID=518738 RepID=UPI003CFFBB8E